MSGKEPISPEEALDRFFHEVRNRALGDHGFAARLVEAIGHPVIFRGAEAVAAVDPVRVAGEGYDAFRDTFMSMKAAEVKKVGRTAGLFVTGEKFPRPLGDLVDLLWDRSNQRRSDIVPGFRQAAE